LTAAAFHHAPASRTSGATGATGAAKTTTLHEAAHFLELVCGEHTSRRKHGFHALLRHLSSQVGNLLDLAQDGFAVGIISAHQFAELDGAQLEVGTSLDGGFLGLYREVVQAANLIIRQLQLLADAGIFRHTQKARAATEAGAAALPSHSPASIATPAAAALPTHSPASIATPAASAFKLPMTHPAELVLAASTKLMLACRGPLPARPSLRRILSPNNHGSGQKHHKSHRAKNQFPSHVQTSAPFLAST
jgi:hypothetical protein